MAQEGVRDNEAERRFELDVDGTTAFAQYRIEGERIVLTHTEVPEQLSGRGVASRLAQGTFEILRRTRRKAMTECTFMASYAAKHPDIADLVGR